MAEGKIMARVERGTFPQPEQHRLGQWVEKHWLPIAAASVGIPSLAGGVMYLWTRLANPSEEMPAQTPSIVRTIEEKPQEPPAGITLQVPTKTPTFIPTKTPEPTVTPTPKPTETPTKTPTPELPKPTSLTAENIDRFTTSVPKEEFQKLVEAQPDKFVFPVKPSSKDVEIKYRDIPSGTPETTKNNYKTVGIIGSENSESIEFFSPFEGKISFLRTDPRNKEKITQIFISKQISPDTDLQTRIFATAITPLIADGQIKAGIPVARVGGKIDFSIITFQKLSQPIVINRPDGGQTKILAYVTYLTPSIFESSGWVEKDGKIVIPQK